MKKTSFKYKKKKLNPGGLINSAGEFTEKGLGITGAGAVGMIGDIIAANSENISVTGGALSGAGKGASMGMAFGPIGAALGGIGGALFGGINANKIKQEQERAKIEADDLREKKQIFSSQAILNNYNNRGIGAGSSFKKGGMINYPYQDQDKGLLINPTIQLADGGYLKPISDTSVEVIGNNPQETDGVELENAFVNHGESIEEDKVYTDEFGINGKKATKKNPSFATLHKRLQKQKTGEDKFTEFDAFIDRKSEALFAQQEALKEGQEGEPGLKKGGKIYIKPSKRGTFTATATKAGYEVQEYASKILANKKKHSPIMVKKANFAKNAAKWNKELGGKISYQDGGTPEDRKFALEEQAALFNREPSTPEEWKVEMELRKYEQSPEEINQRIQDAELSAKNFLYEKKRKGNPQFETIEPSGAKPYMTYKPGSLNSWYQQRIGGEVQGIPLQERLATTSSKLGLDPVEFTAAMVQEGVNAESFNTNLKEAGNIDSYGFGLDTVGEYSDAIEKKLGKEYSRETLNLYPGENERRQAVTPALFKDSQRFLDTAGALYQHRADIVDKTAKDLGIELSPWEKRYFNYMSYNTQHNAPNAVVFDKENAGEEYNSSIKRMMNKFREAKKLGLSEDEFHKYIDVSGDALTTPFGAVDKGDGQLFYNAGNYARRLKKLQGAYEQDIPFYLKAPDKEEINTVPKLNKGGYTDMNTLSAKHMEANLTKRKKKKKGYQGGGDKLDRYSQGNPTGAEDFFPGKPQRYSQMTLGAESTILPKPIRYSQMTLGAESAMPTDKTIPVAADATNLQLQKPIKKIPYSNVDYQSLFKEYKNGGKMKKKYIHGGKDPVLKDIQYEEKGTLFNPSLKTPEVPEAEGLGYIPISDLKPPNPIRLMGKKSTSTPTYSASENKSFDFQKLGDAFGTYGANIAGMTTRLPEVPKPEMLSPTKLARIENAEELDRINRGYRGSVAGVDQGVAQAGAAESTKASLLAKKLAAENASFDRTDKTNIAIQNQEAAINAQQDATNTRIQNQFLQDQLGRDLKELEIRRDSLTNMADKYMLGRSEDKRRLLDLDKMNLTKEMFAGTQVDTRTMERLKELNPELYKIVGGKKFGGLIKRKPGMKVKMKKNKFRKMKY